MGPISLGWPQAHLWASAIQSVFRPSGFPPTTVTTPGAVLAGVAHQPVPAAMLVAAEDFHRWRRESSVLAGVDRRPMPAPVIGQLYTLGATPEPYTDADEMEQYVAAIVHDATVLLGPALTAIRQAFEAGAHSLSNGAFGFK